MLAECLPTIDDALRSAAKNPPLPQSSPALLVVDDSEDDFVLIRELVGEATPEFDAVVHAPTAAEALAIVDEKNFALALVDYRLGGRTGLDLLHDLRCRGCDLPVILLTGVGDEQLAVDAMKAGATDYLTKRRLGPACLRAAIRSAIQLHEREVNLRAAEAELRLREEQLHQSQKMEAIGRLAGGIAHDFNNLLMVISGYAELLAQKNNDPATLRSTEEILKATQRGAALTRQLLSFSRKQAVSPRPLNLNSVIGDMRRLLERMIGENIELVLVPGESIGCVRADPVQIGQIMMNLAANAHDAMPNGGRLEVRIERATQVPAAALPAGLEPGQYVLLTVSDTGIGFDADTQARIFEPFFTTKNGRGTGLGLATVYGIVRQSGGAIAVSSTPGRGTTFSIYLPCTHEKPELVVVRPPERSLTAGSETVLIAEDQDAVRDAAAQFLTLRGYRVLQARSGSEAIEIARQHGRVDLLLTDVLMPGMSGRDLAQALAARLPGLRVLYMSGYCEGKTLLDDAAGADTGFLAKPFALADLEHEVRALLDRSRSAPPRADTPS